MSGIQTVWTIVTWPFRAARKVVGSIFSVFVLVAIAAALMQPKPSVPDQVALLIDPVGVIVEQATQVDPADQFFNEMFGATVPETELQDILDALDRAATDDRVEAVVLYLDNMIGAGPSTMHRITHAIDEFKDTGKPVYALGGGYGDSQYILAAQADEVIMHPFGAVVLTGYGRYRSYYADLLARLEVNVNVFRVGTFKSAIEPYLRNDMSDAAREANLGYMGVLWDNYTMSVETARGFPAGAINDSIENISANLEAAGGDLAIASLNGGLVDSLMYPDEYRAHIGETVGMDEESGTFNQISLHSYLAATSDDANGSGDQVAVITAAGVIVDGEAPAGTAGGDTVARMIRQAHQNDDVAAIVLRVDSPGGSAYASEVIRRELVVAREKGLPVVISMGDLAASGGYWISTASDEIWASPTTITGSIGIFGMIPTFEGTLGLAGIHSDGVGTTPLAGAFDVSRELNPVVGNLIQQSIEDGYEKFINRVMEARDMTFDEVDSIAQGRVWAGATALELGLVDQLGEFEDAVASAAEMAGLEDYQIQHYLEPVKTLPEQLMEGFSSQVMIGLGLDDGIAATQLPEPISAELARSWSDFRLMTQFNDPNHAYVVCLECTTLAQ